MIRFIFMQSFLSRPKYQYLRDRLEEVSRIVGYDVMECSNDEVLALDELPSGNQKFGCV